MRKIAWIALFLVMIILLAPWLAGVWFERTYRQLISNYNSQGDVAIQIEQYHRSWFHSNAVVHVQIIKSEVRNFWSAFGVENPILDITVDQQIQHGPIIYGHFVQLPSIFGLAAIHNSVHLSPDIQKVFQPVNSDQLNIQNDDLISLTGSYFKYFKIDGFQLVHSQSNLHFNFHGGIKGNTWISSTLELVSGEINIPDFALNNSSNIAKFSDAKITYDQYKAASGLWLGDVALKMPEMSLNDVNGVKFNFYDIALKADATESAGKINGSRRLDIQKINIGKQLIGPLHLNLSAYGLNAKAIEDMIATYRKVLREGERYDSQLRYKLFALLPQVLDKNSGITLESLSIKAPNGLLQMKGEITWPQGVDTQAEGLDELFETTNAKANLRISKLLADELIQIAADLPYFRTITPERRHELIAMQDTVGEVSQQNFLLLSALVDHGYLAEDAALALLSMQKDDDSLELYNALLKDLLLKKEITLPISYLLAWQYTEVKRQTNLFETALDGEQRELKQQFQSQVDQWLKNGYVSIDKNDYVVQIQKTNDVIKMNGKELPQGVN